MQKANNIIIKILLLLAFLIILSDVCFGQSSEEGKPLWEFGFVNVSARLPHYRGSDEYRWYILPLPYLIYRGEFIQSDREGVKGVFYKSKYLETNISLFGNPPVEGNNEAREGMPDLDALFEMGPALKWFFMGRDPKNTLYLRLAIRMACSIGFDDGMDIAYQGLHGGVNLIYNNRSLFKNHMLSFGLNAGIDFTDSELNSYFYDVQRQYVRPGREFYESNGGYAGFFLAATLQKRLTENLSLGFYSRWENISGAVFEDSPLVRAKNNFVVGSAIIWKIAVSKKRVKLNK
jgi:outer membrane scaffolding protein for murein synthesis (MipA/OmpV family)